MKRTDIVTKLGQDMVVIAKAIQLHHGREAVCLSPALDNTVLLIGHEGEANVKQLARIMAISSGGATQHIEALEADGFVQRRPNQHDRRETLVSLTDKGVQLYKELHQRHLRLLTEAFSPLNDQELEQLSTLADRVRQGHEHKESAS